jgi:hypothetical protein
MKKTITIATLTLSLVCGVAYGQSRTERISRELSFEKMGTQNALLIANVNGSITVEGYSGNTLLIEVEKIINGKTTERLEAGLKEISLGVIDSADTIVLYINGICQPFGKNPKGHGRHWGHWGYNWERCNPHEVGYDFRMNFTVRVPEGINISVSTINEGDINVSKVSGSVRANNVNGAIRLTELSKSAWAHTVNGDVDISYLQNPGAECSFYTLNGDINAHFRKGLSSTIKFKSFNGDLFTNVETLVTLPTGVQQQQTDKGKKYSVDGNRFQVGKGGALLDFETFNGNVYLREN